MIWKTEHIVFSKFATEKLLGDKMHSKFLKGKVSKQKIGRQVSLKTGATQCTFGKI